MHGITQLRTFIGLLYMVKAAFAMRFVSLFLTHSFELRTSRVDASKTCTNTTLPMPTR